MMIEDSLFRRYIIKLISTGLIVLLGAMLQMILPRALGAEMYGVYTYNLNTFTSLVVIANLSTTNAFRTKVAKRRNDYGIILFYAKFNALMIFALNVGIMLAERMDILQEYNISSNVFLIFLALNFSCTVHLLQELAALYDAYVMTRYSEPILVITKLLITVIVFLVYAMQMLSLELFYIIQIVLNGGIIFVLISLFFHKQRILYLQEGIKQKNHMYFKEFIYYCRPMVIAMFSSNMITLLSNWMLMNYSGAYEQAYYGVAWQLNSLIAYTFTPVISLLQREYAVKSGDKENLYILYKKTMRITLILVCYFACFVIVNAGWLLELLFGKEYLPAVLVTRLIMIYTIYQAWGQVNGTLYISTERTKAYSILSIFNQLISFVFIYVFLNPGLKLGAAGMGFQLVLTSFIGIPLLVFYNCRYLKIKFWEEYKIQFEVSLLCISLAIITRIILSCCFNSRWIENNMFFVVLINGVLYTLFFAIAGYIFSDLIDLDRKQIISLFKNKKR